MAGTEEGWAEARTRLQAMAAKSPDDIELQLSYARVLTYREVTRREGIERLARLAPRSPDADRSWRDALLWLDAGRADEALFKAYADAHPDDGDVNGRWAKVIEPMKPDNAIHAVTLAYGAVAERKYAEAETLFLKALEFDPNNTNALTGMAGLRMRVGRAREAMEYMQRAVAIEPTLREEYHDLYDAANFLNDYNAASGAARAGRYAQAERLLRPLVAGRAKERSIAVALLASVLASQKKYAEAEKYYREALRLRPRDRTVVTGLYRVLVARGKVAEAEALANQVPPDVRAEVGRSLVQAEAQAAVMQAESRARAGDIPGAIAAYTEAISKDPEDPWTRLAYARLLRGQGQAALAEDVMRPVLAKPAPTAADFHVGALFALDRDRLQEAGALINAIPGPQRNAEIRRLSEDIARKTTILQARRSIAGGDREQALAALRTLSSRNDLDPGTWGEIAAATAEMGDTNQALAIARRELAKPIPANASLSSYGGLIGIVARYGSENETQTLVSRFRSKARTAEEIRLVADIEAGLVGTQADRLRQANQIRPAYDLLVARLQRDPQNTTLLAALARVYASAKMYDEADRIYAALLARKPEDQDLAMQAVWVAINQRDYDRARRLIDPLLEGAVPSSQLYFANGILLRAEGDNGGAIHALEKAKELRARELGVAPTSLAPLSSNTDGLQALPNFL
ncbi:MAG: tetratricopeptide repeat protein [Zavarzinia sp.]|nr:tetratricopeptide repeat protein [Zavarzinia sp.]